MALAIVTGSGGLIGSETVQFFCQSGFEVIGLDNNLRATFFGAEASTAWNQKLLQQRFSKHYRHINIDIRNQNEVDTVFRTYERRVDLVVHTAAQPSHDWSVREPLTYFSINATATLILLEATRRYCPEAVFIFTSTNKVYGDTPNQLPLVEQETRWEVDATHRYANGIDETMSIDASKHSLFGASKVAADVFVQEYGRYFAMRTVCFRCGCLTGPNHSGTALHGFLAYLMKCVSTGKAYSIYGYRGKQVRDNLHSADLVSAFYQFYLSPRIGEVYNMGGSRSSNCSLLEAIDLCEEISGKTLHWTYTDTNRSGDHIWYISDTSKFQSHFPEWRQHYNLNQILEDIWSRNIERWMSSSIC